MQWPGSTTAGHRSHEGAYATTADTLLHCCSAAVQPAVRFGGSFLIYDATVSNCHTAQTTQWRLTSMTTVRYLPYRWTALCEKNRCSSGLNTARLQLLTSVT